MKSKYLYVGSGAEQLENFIHADISVYKISKIKDPNKKKIDIICDITEEIPLPDKSIELVYSRETLEHLTWRELINHFIECNRILEDGGIIRMSLPNFDKMIERYKNNDEDLDEAIKNSETSEFLAPIENHTDLFISRILYHDHYYLHNFDTMNRALKKCGFAEVTIVKPGETKIKNLEEILFRAEHTTYDKELTFRLEAVKILPPSILKYEMKKPKNIIKKLFASLFNISFAPYIKRRPMFPSKKWFLEKYLKLKQLSTYNKKY